METFIVRIYRRVAGDPDAAGTVEHVDTGERMPFTDTKELLQRLLGTTSQPHDNGSEPPSGADPAKPV